LRRRRTADTARVESVRPRRAAAEGLRLNTDRRTAWLLLLCAGVAAAVFLAVASGLRG